MSPSCPRMWSKHSSRSRTAASTATGASTRAALRVRPSPARAAGSTITQQLAKFTFLTPERTMTRKAREALIAFWLEAWLTKDEILERYLSNAYFGDNVYGLRAASLHYFYRKPENLKPNQAAMLAGLLQAPSALMRRPAITTARPSAWSWSSSRWLPLVTSPRPRPERCARPRSMCG